MFHRQFETTRRILSGLLLLWLVAGALPVPMMHLHGNEIEPGDSAQLALHLELRHASTSPVSAFSSDDACRSNAILALVSESQWHLHWFWIPELADENSSEPDIDRLDLWDSTLTVKASDYVQDLAAALNSRLESEFSLVELTSHGSLFEPSQLPEHATCPALSMLRRLNQ